jgi:hypothetical protein
MKSYLHLIWHNPSMPKYQSECTGDQILNFQNAFDRAWNEIRMKIQTENFFRILISTRLDFYGSRSKTKYTRFCFKLHIYTYDI